MKKYKQCNQVIEKMNDVMKYDVWKSIQIHWKIYKQQVKVKYIMHMYNWDSSRENDNSHLYIKCYINASRLNRYIFRTVNVINILFSTHHTTPFLYGKILFGILHLLLASIATFDTPPGSNPP